MKTAEEKAMSLLDENSVSGAAYNRLLRALILAFKEQDRDSRHACAEELLKVTRYGGSDEPLIILHEAQAACINTRAV